MWFILNTRLSVRYHRETMQNPQQQRWSGQIAGLTVAELDLAATLSSGQVFRWGRDGEGLWRGTVGERPVRLMQSTDYSTLWWEAAGSSAEEAGAAVRSFLRLDDADLAGLAQEWVQRDALFARAWQQNPGVRLLRQDPDECFFSFLCASVAPIARISRMLHAVAAEAGTALPTGEIPFPTASALANVSEQRLRELGLGFRARRVAAAAHCLTEFAESPLPLLRGAELAEIRRVLGAFTGVGNKIADCIALFSLDRDDAIPVDTHIWRIARTHYLPDLSGKSLTAANYARVEAAFRDRFGPKAGWAQQILFYRAAVGKTTS
ncbi:MAG: DNA-3-methyladenine glycosylase [Armatimonadaceae bacterium]